MHNVSCDLRCRDDYYWCNRRPKALENIYQEDDLWFHVDNELGAGRVGSHTMTPRLLRYSRMLEDRVRLNWAVRAFLWVVDEARQLIDDLPQDGSRRLYELWKEVSVRRKGQSGALTPVDRLRLLLIRLSETWDRYCTFSWHSEIPWTNNGTEQVIGGM